MRYNQFDYKKEDPIPARRFVNRRAIEDTELFQDLNIYAGKRGEKLVLENGKLIKVNLVD
jgi:hypothetical protein